MLAKTRYLIGQTLQHLPLLFQFRFKIVLGTCNDVAQIILRHYQLNDIISNKYWTSFEISKYHHDIRLIVLYYKIPCLSHFTLSFLLIIHLKFFMNINLLFSNKYFYFVDVQVLSYLNHFQSQKILNQLIFCFVKNRISSIFKLKNSGSDGIEC